jgi:hypothetical protein
MSMRGNTHRDFATPRDSHPSEILCALSHREKEVAKPTRDFLFCPPLSRSSGPAFRFFESVSVIVGLLPVVGIWNVECLHVKVVRSLGKRRWIPKAALPSWDTSAFHLIAAWSMRGIRQGYKKIKLIGVQTIVAV